MKHETYLARKARGLCVNCGHRPAVPGAVKCERCRESDKRFRERRNAEAAAGGTCIDCGRKAESGALCASCRAKRKEAAKTRYWHKREQGLCAECGKVPAMPGRVRCEACEEKAQGRQQARRERLRKQGLCVRCGGPTDSGGLCFDCRVKSSADYYARKERRAQEEMRCETAYGPRLEPCACGRRPVFRTETSGAMTITCPRCRGIQVVFDPAAAEQAVRQWANAARLRAGKGEQD